MTAVDRRAAFRRTRRTAVGVVGAALLTLLLTEPGSAAPDAAAEGTGQCFARLAKRLSTEGR